MRNSIEGSARHLRKRERSGWRDEWRDINRANRDERAPIHASGEFYDVADSSQARSGCDPSRSPRSGT